MGPPLLGGKAVHALWGRAVEPEHPLRRLRGGEQARLGGGDARAGWQWWRQVQRARRQAFGRPIVPPAVVRTIAGSPGSAIAARSGLHGGLVRARLGRAPTLAGLSRRKPVVSSTSRLVRLHLGSVAKGAWGSVSRPRGVPASWPSSVWRAQRHPAANWVVALRAAFLCPQNSSDCSRLWLPATAELEATGRSWKCSLAGACLRSSWCGACSLPALGRPSSPRMSRRRLQFRLRAVGCSGRP